VQGRFSSDWFKHLGKEGSAGKGEVIPMPEDGERLLRDLLTANRPPRRPLGHPNSTPGW